MNEQTSRYWITADDDSKIESIWCDELECSMYPVEGVLVAAVKKEPVCNCGQCGRIHSSDCAVHNGPHAAACDCVVEVGEERR